MIKERLISKKINQLIKIQKIKNDYEKVETLCLMYT